MKPQWKSPQKGNSGHGDAMQVGFGKFPIDPVELTRRLVRIPSPTGSERDISDYLHSWLEKAGFSVLKQEVSPGRNNLLALAGNPNVVLSSHVDTVSPAIDFGEDETYLYGRGACDTRGSIAAMLVAGRNLLHRGGDNFGILLLVGEEGPHDGAKRANEWDRAGECQFLINGEPTGNRMAKASLGGLLLHLKTRGSACHSGTPGRGISAVHELLDMIQEIRAMPLRENDLLGTSSVNVGTISGGIQANILAPEAECRILFRLVDSPEQWMNTLESRFHGRGEIRIISAYPPVFLNTLPGFPETVAPFGTDIPFLSRWGRPFLLGPGDIADAHSPGERIEKKQIIAAVSMYMDLVERLPGEPEGYPRP